MNHDYEHCIDFNDGCPESCHRAQLVRDLEENYPEMEVSWMNFSDCPDCERNRLAKNSPKAAKNIDDQISRSAIVSALKERAETLKGTYGDLGGACSGAAKLAESMPPVQHEITHEQAVGYLQSTGWMQNHDLQMMLDGVHRFTAQPESCEDTVSRKAAIDALNEYFVRIGKLKRRGLNEGEKAISLDVVGAIKGLPPATTEQDWIPVNKEMPPLRHDVWLTVFFHESWMVVEGYRQDGEFMFWYRGRLESALDEENRVTAWKLKSKPYQPDAK